MPIANVDLDSLMRHVYESHTLILTCIVPLRYVLSSFIEGGPRFVDFHSANDGKGRG